MVLAMIPDDSRCRVARPAELYGVRPTEHLGGPTRRPLELRGWLAHIGFYSDKSKNIPGFGRGYCKEYVNVTR